MELSDPGKTRHLSLDNLVVNPRLARCLPSNLAYRYHALPVAEDSDRITIVMADPDDTVACEEIVSVLGRACCVVKGDPATIERVLAKVWPEETRRSLRLLVCIHVNSFADELWGYAQAIGTLLHAQISYLPKNKNTGPILDALAEQIPSAGYDLVLLGEADRSLEEQLLLSSKRHRTTTQTPTSLLIAQQPRWPLRKILLIIQGKESDDVAVDWTVRLARPSEAAVTILTMVLPGPAMYPGTAHMQQGVAALLAGNSVLGLQMHQAAQRLADWEIDSTLRLCQGSPDWLVHREVAKGDYDLIVVAARNRCRWLQRADHRPVLVARPAPA